MSACGTGSGVSIPDAPESSHHQSSSETYCRAAGRHSTHTLLFWKVNTVIGSIHFENMPIQYTEIFKVVKNENFQ